MESRTTTPSSTVFVAAKAVPFTVTNSCPAWDESYILIPGEYRAVDGKLDIGYARYSFQEVTVRAKVVNVAKPSLLGGCIVGRDEHGQAMKGKEVEITIATRHIKHLDGVEARSM